MTIDDYMSGLEADAPIEDTSPCDVQNRPEMARQTSMAWHC